MLFPGPLQPLTIHQSDSGARAAALLSLLALVADDAPRLLRDCAHTDANKVTFYSGTQSARDCDWPVLFSRFRAVVDGTPPALRRVASPPHTVPIPDSTAHLRTLTADPRITLLHARIAHILAASGAAAHIDRILADTAVEDLDAAGGTTSLGRLMALRLEGWWDGGRQRKRQRRRDSVECVWMEASTFVEERSCETLNIQNNEIEMIT